MRICVNLTRIQAPVGGGFPSPDAFSGTPV